MIIMFLDDHELRKEIDCRVTDGPFQRVEDVHFHLGEHAGIVKSAAHVVELVNLGNAVFLVTVLGRDKERSAANKLIVLFVDYAFRTVAVEEVDCEKEGLREQSEGSVGLNQEVDEVRTHEPLDLALHVNEIGIGQSLGLILSVHVKVYVSGA